ncbi:thermonuclease family protein [Acidovorax temperans]|uniref:thermonuclease family protein n=1 Tax=Acidovorax temperans TaxID=80878 RepID=UPI003D33AFBA
MVAILDGYTINVLVDRHPVRVRLAQIDAPEKRQAFGTRSKQVLAELVFRQTVRVAEAGHERHGCVIGTVYVGDVDVNAQMVREGTRATTSRSVWEAIRPTWGGSRRPLCWCRKPSWPW